MITPADYDAWYRSSRGRWIGERESRRLLTDLHPEVGASVLDVGCGTGYFTRQLALAGLHATGIDADAAMVRFAQTQRTTDEIYLTGNASALPFADRQFDYGIAITSFCFIEDQVTALRELLRVSRVRVALGLLNRHSLLYLRKGRHGGRGGYRAAHWHSPSEVHRLFGQAGLVDIRLRSAIYLSGDDGFTRLIERLTPARLTCGAFLLAIAAVPAANEDRETFPTL